MIERAGAERVTTDIADALLTPHVRADKDAPCCCGASRATQRPD
jgi:hypothetical protein